jgi:DNA-directed RNA polymerase subunit RPC12/RpoP
MKAEFVDVKCEKCGRVIPGIKVDTWAYCNKCNAWILAEKEDQGDTKT